jgi:tetratricopeptide (TPR) repeat protein
MTRHLCTLAILAIVVSPTVRAQNAPATQAKEAPQPPEAALQKEARGLEFNDGKRDEALVLYRRILDKAPSDFNATLGVGRILIVEGKYAEGRQRLQKAIDAAPETDLNAALSTMAISYAFEGNAAEAAKYYQRVITRQMEAKAFSPAANTANALARTYLEAGDPANAEQWYRMGYETARKVENRSPEDTDLWEMRWHHAQGRIAARRKEFDVARKHVDEVRSIVSKGKLDKDQAANLPHLAGYVSFHQGNLDDAIAELSKADQNDPFILSLLAQSYEQKKDMPRARELYEKILASPGYSLQLAFARPLAQRKLAVPR